jgi:hypothetical protein
MFLHLSCQNPFWQAFARSEESVAQTSQLASVTYPNWQKTEYSYYNNLGDQRLQEIKNEVVGVISNTPLSKFDYTYNPVGTIAIWQQM